MIVTFEVFYRKPGDDKPKWHVVDSGHMQSKMARRRARLMRAREPERPLRLWRESKTGMTLMKEYLA